MLGIGFPLQKFFQASFAKLNPFCLYTELIVREETDYTCF